jgi:hypothetical protein
MQKHRQRWQLNPALKLLHQYQEQVQHLQLRQSHK